MPSSLCCLFSGDQFILEKKQDLTLFKSLWDPTTVGECRLNTPLGPGLRGIIKRYHCRLWKLSPEIWCGGIHLDVAIAFKKWNLVHRIDPMLDKAKEELRIQLEKSPRVREISYLLSPPASTLRGKTANGFPYQWDGRILVAEF